MPRARGCRSFDVLVLALAATVLLAAPESPSAPLTNEDVVRLLEAGAPAETVVERIRSSAAAFDLAPDAVDELRQAHVPEVVLRAMRERQAYMPPAAHDATEGTMTPRTRVLLTIEVEGAAPHRGSTRQLEFPARLDPAAAARLGIEDAQETPAIDGAAVFLACVTPEHVPDGWKNTSPLGEDFPRMLRHEMLAFAGEAILERPALAKAAPRAVVLPVPASLAAEAAAGPSHDWLFGIAIHAGGRWHLLASASTRAESLRDASTALTGSIRILKRNPFAPELELRASATRSSTPPPPPS